MTERERWLVTLNERTFFSKKSKNLKEWFCPSHTHTWKECERGCDCVRKGVREGVIAWERVWLHERGCDCVRQGVTAWDRVWLRETGCECVREGASVWERVWLCEGGCDCVGEGVSVRGRVWMCERKRVCERERESMSVRVWNMDLSFWKMDIQSKIPPTTSNSQTKVFYFSWPPPT